MLFEFLFGEVAQGPGGQSAVLVEVFHALVNDFHPDPIHVHFLRAAEMLIGKYGIRAILWIRLIVGRNHGIAIARLVNLHGFAIEIRFREMARRAPEIHQSKVKFVRVLVYARATPDDLFELGHGTDDAVEHNQAAGLDIDAGGKQARGRDQYGICGFRVHKVVELGLTFGVVAGDTHDIVVVLIYQIGVLIDEGLSHAAGVFLVDAKDDRFLEPVAAFLQKLRHLAGDQLGAFVQHQGVVKVPGVVGAVFDLIAVSVALVSFRAIAFYIPVNMNFDDFVGREKAILDALFQGVGIDRIPKVMDVGVVLGFLGCGG